MKTIIAAVLALTATTATATTIGGCEMTTADNGNYLFKSDNACAFTGVNLSDAFGAKGVTDK